MTDRETIENLKIEMLKTRQRLDQLIRLSAEFEKELNICNELKRFSLEDRQFEYSSDVAYIGAFKMAKNEITTLDVMEKMIQFEMNKNTNDIAYLERVLQTTEVKIDYLIIKIRYSEPVAPVDMTIGDAIREEFSPEQYNVG